MLSARAIYRLLIEDDPPAEPQPPQDEPNQQPLDDLGDLDVAAEIERYTGSAGGPRIPGHNYVNVYNRIQNRLNGRPRRKIGNATYLITNDDGSLSVRYHDTDVVTAFPDGKVTVDSGGWRPGGRHEYGSGTFTMPAGTTTMARINDWLSGGWTIYRLTLSRISHEGGEWRWTNRSGHNWEGFELPYNDGDTIYPDGSLQLQEPPIPKEPKRRRRE